METSTLSIYKELEKFGVKFVDYAYLTVLTGVTNPNTLYKIVKRLIDKNILKTLIDGKYQVVNSVPTDFEIANYIYNPSYISLESALSYYGILSQFVYTITSITTKKSNIYEISEKALYRHLPWAEGKVVINDDGTLVKPEATKSEGEE